jgi:hypothetical protein
MDKWFKDILPDKDPYHNRGRDQMRKKGGVRNSSACGLTIQFLLRSPRDIILTFSSIAAFNILLKRVQKFGSHWRSDL